jgi:DNA-binding SARP family transcriptional activator/tetratricopeptide (TPR) repeat protein
MSPTTVLQLKRHFSAVIQKSPGQVIGLHGEAGVGKSFLLETLLRETPCKHLMVHSGMSIAELARGLPRVTNLPAWAKTQLEQLQQGQTLNAQALADTLVVTLSALVPFILVFEDLHDASSERLELILNLAKVIPRIRSVCLIASSRGVLPEAFYSYRLEALDRKAADALLEVQAKGALPPEALEWVYARAQGNALFTLEFWRYLLRLGAFWSDGERWQWRKPDDDFVPISIEALILELLESQIDAPTRAVLEAKVLLEQLELSVPKSIWAQVANVSLGQLSKSQTQLEASSLLHDGRFAHPLFREVLAHEIPVERWRKYAGLALEALELEHPERAAVLLDILELETVVARRLLEAAQNSAEARGDRIAAAKWLGRLVEFLEQPERSQKAFEAAKETFGFDLAGAEKLTIIASSGDPTMLEAVVFRAEILGIQGHVQQAHDILESLAGQESVALKRFWTLLYLKQTEGKYQEVMQLWQSHPELHASVDMYTLSNIGGVLTNLEKFEEAEHFVALMFARKPTDPNSLYYAWNLRARIYAAQKKHNEALEAFETSIQLARQVGFPRIIAQSLHNYAIAALNAARNAARFEDVRIKLEEAVELSAQAGHTRSYSENQDLLAGVLKLEGRFEEAQTLYRQNEAVFAVLPNMLTSRCDNHIYQAWLYLDWQPTSGIPLALRHARAGLSLARQIGGVGYLASALSMTARAEALNRNPETAMSLAQELRALAEKNPAQKAISLQTLAVAFEATGRNDEARAVYLEAQGAYLHHGEESEAERAALEADRLMGDIQSAKKRHAWFLAQGLLGDAKVALRYFPAISATESSSSSASETAESNLRLNVLGLAQLERDGQKIVYRGKKRLELLCYLLEARIAGRNEVSAFELAEVFYPDHSDKDAKHTLRQQIYLIRNELGQQIIHSTTNGYALQDISSDAESFFTTLDTRLWRGAYLERMSEGWDGNVGESLMQALRSSFERLLENDFTEAARVGEILLTMQPYDSDLLLQVLQAHHGAGLTKSATRLYSEAQERFWGVHETLPKRLEDFLNAKLEPRVASMISGF